MVNGDPQKVGSDRTRVDFKVLLLFLERVHRETVSGGKIKRLEHRQTAIGKL